jgi:hypothetical protein
MTDQEKDFATLLEDVKTIKSIFQNEDAPFPRMWVVAWTVAPVVALAGLLQYFVPFFRSQSFDGNFLFLWLPAFCVLFPLILVFLYREIGRTGKKFLGQGRMRHLLFARFVIPPAALVLVWLLSRHPVLSLEGSVLLVVSMWLTAIEQVFPALFRVVPLGFFGLGLVELGFGLTGPETALADILLVAAAMTFVGFLFRRQRTGES